MHGSLGRTASGQRTIDAKDREQHIQEERWKAHVEECLKSVC